MLVLQGCGAQLKVRFGSWSGIYLLMLQNRLHGREGLLVCESCECTIEQVVCFCDGCLSLFCQLCSNNHGCGLSPELHCGSADSKANRIGTEGSDGSSYSVSLNQLIQSNRYSKNNVNQSPQKTCQRCQLAVGNARCVKCMNKIFCQECFNQMHSVQKFKQHQAINIKSIQQLVRQDIVINIRQQSPNRNQKNKKAVTCIRLFPGNLGQGQRRLVGIQKNKSMEIQKKEEISSKITRLNLIRNGLQNSCSQVEKKLRELITKTTEQLESVIEETRLKMIQFQMKLREKMRTTVADYDCVLREISKVETFYRNSAKIIEQSLFLGNQQKRVSERMEMLNDKFTDCLRKNQEVNCPYGSSFVSQQFSCQIQKAKQILRRIDFKKSVMEVENLKNLTSCTMSSPRSDKKKISVTKLNSDLKPPLKCSLNLSNCKSMDRMGPLTMSQMQTQSKQIFQEINLLKNFNDINLTQSVNCESYRATPSEQSAKMRNPYKDSKISTPGTTLGKQKMTIKQFRSKGTLQKSTFIPKNNSENEAKFGVKKTLLNIQKTKNMIKEMRNQINEFTIRYTKQKNETLHTQKDQEIEFQLQNLASSRISIESFVLDEENIG